ncbi:hypothetical protein [Paraburkholderia atlantica]|uniref:hypothetical protein n=1 Tax=Paraburkholderia atlantica TaxID=2654982 RepID=UPI003D2333D0
MSKTLITFLVAFSLGTAGCSRVEPAKPPMPGMGTIHGVRMVIPAEYKFFGVEYEGDDIWARPPKRHAPGPDVPIRSFSIMLHLPDFAPLNDSNRDSWIGRKGHDAKRNEWTQVGIHPIEGVWKDTGRWFSDFYITGHMEGKIEQQFERDSHFNKEPTLVHGLVNEKIVGPDYSIVSIRHVEIFYDPNRSTTFIVCGTGAGGPNYCHQTFLVPELGVLVDAVYAKSNLKYWGDIQKNLTRIVISFKQN